MRIKPIEKPRSILLKLTYWMTKRQYGKVIGPVKVIYSRKVPLLFFTKKLFDTDKKIKLNHNDKLLIRNFVSHLNNCSFCSDLSAYEAAKSKVKEQKILELLNYRQSSSYTEKEKALLTYVEEVTTIKNASDQTFDNLKKFFGETEIVEITWVCATENYLNLIAKPLGVKSDGLQATLSR